MGSKKSSQETTSAPPSWAKPGLKTVGQESLRLYNEGKGYNVYGGPTQTDLSPQTLLGMNNMMAATGAAGPGGLPPITNESIKSLIPSEQVQKMIADLKAKNVTDKTASQTKQQRQGGGNRHHYRFPENSWLGINERRRFGNS